MGFEKMKKQLIEWTGISNIDNHIYEYKNKNGENVIKIKLYTFVNEYTITAIFNKDKKKRYLGCQNKCRKPRAGEDWRRGRDLADGEFNIATWERIVYDIVKNELVKVHRPIRKLYEEKI